MPFTRSPAIFALELKIIRFIFHYRGNDVFQKGLSLPDKIKIDNIGGESGETKMVYQLLKSIATLFNNKRGFLEALYSKNLKQQSYFKHQLKKSKEELNLKFKSLIASPVCLNQLLEKKSFREIFGLICVMHELTTSNWLEKETIDTLIDEVIKKSDSPAEKNLTIFMANTIGRHHEYEDFDGIKTINTLTEVNEGIEDPAEGLERVIAKIDNLFELEFDIDDALEYQKQFLHYYLTTRIIRWVESQELSNEDAFACYQKLSRISYLLRFPIEISAAADLTNTLAIIFKTMQSGMLYYSRYCLDESFISCKPLFNEHLLYAQLQRFYQQPIERINNVSSNHIGRLLLSCRNEDMSFAWCRMPFTKSEFSRILGKILIPRRFANPELVKNIRELSLPAIAIFIECDQVYSALNTIRNYIEYSEIDFFSIPREATPITKKQSKQTQLYSVMFFSIQLFRALNAIASDEEDKKIKLEELISYCKGKRHDFLKKRFVIDSEYSEIKKQLVLFIERCLLRFSDNLDISKLTLEEREELEYVYIAIQKLLDCLCKKSEKSKILALLDKSFDIKEYTRLKVKKDLKTLGLPSTRSKKGKASLPGAKAAASGVGEGGAAGAAKTKEETAAQTPPLALARASEPRILSSSIPTPILSLASQYFSDTGQKMILTGGAISDILIHSCVANDYDFIINEENYDHIKLMLTAQEGTTFSELVTKKGKLLKVEISQEEGAPNIQIDISPIRTIEGIEKALKKAMVSRDFKISSLYIELDNRDCFLIKGYSGAIKSYNRKKISSFDPFNVFHEDLSRLLRLVKLSIKYPRFEIEEFLLHQLKKMSDGEIYAQLTNHANWRVAKLYQGRVNSALISLFKTYTNEKIITAINKLNILSIMTGLDADICKKIKTSFLSYANESLEARVKKLRLFLVIAAHYLYSQPLKDRKPLESWPFYSTLRHLDVDDRVFLIALDEKARAVSCKSCMVVSPDFSAMIAEVSASYPHNEETAPTPAILSD